MSPISRQALPVLGQNMKIPRQIFQIPRHFPKILRQISCRFAIVSAECPDAAVHYASRLTAQAHSHAMTHWPTTTSHAQRLLSSRRMTATAATQGV